jgi:hypothetical protein
MVAFRKHKQLGVEQSATKLAKENDKLKKLEPERRYGPLDNNGETNSPAIETDAHRQLFPACRRSNRIRAPHMGYRFSAVGHLAAKMS